MLNASRILGGGGKEASPCPSTGWNPDMGLASKTTAKTERISTKSARVIDWIVAGM